ncbi:MAG: hypothetical protein HQL22_12430, partial [Candidatus Omnitrophica bacterium]|nr:hypothetical protein [Candidatus Omnitrophota bacterium]
SGGMGFYHVLHAIYVDPSNVALLSSGVPTAVIIRADMAMKDADQAARPDARLDETTVTAVGTRSGWKEFLPNYKGEVYYPAGELDMDSLKRLKLAFGRWKRFVIAETFDSNEKGLPNVLSGDLGLVARQLDAQFSSRYRGVRVTTSPEKGEINVRFIETGSGLEWKRLKNSAFHVRYVLNDLFRLTERFDVVYVKFPGLGGRMAGDRRFWEKIHNQTGRFLLVDEFSTIQPPEDLFILAAGEVTNPMRWVRIYELVPTQAQDIALKGKVETVMGASLSVARGQLLTIPKSGAIKLLRDILPLSGQFASKGKWISVLTFDANKQLNLVFDDTRGSTSLGHAGLLVGTGFDLKHPLRMDWMRMDAQYNQQGDLDAVEINAPVLSDVVTQINAKLRAIKFLNISDTELSDAYERARRNDCIYLARLLMASFGKESKAVNVRISGNIEHFFPGVKTVAALALQNLVDEKAKMSAASLASAHALYAEIQSSYEQLIGPFESQDPSVQPAFYKTVRTILDMIGRDLENQRRSDIWNDWEILRENLDSLGTYNSTHDISDDLERLREITLRVDSVGTLERSIQKARGQELEKLKRELAREKFVADGHFTIDIAGALFRLREEYLRISPLLWQSLASDLKGSVEEDFAMKGGIDLTRDKIGLHVQGVGDGVQFRFDPAMIRQLQHASGLTPVIVDIQPMTTTVPMFLGLNAETEKMAVAR